VQLEIEAVVVKELADPAHLSEVRGDMYRRGDEG